MERCDNTWVFGCICLTDCYCLHLSGMCVVQLYTPVYCNFPHCCWAVEAFWPGGVHPEQLAWPSASATLQNQPSVFVFVPFQTKPCRRMTVHRPPFISRFEEPSCLYRLELRKRRANWKLILVWVPEMSAACLIPGAFVHSHHILRPWMQLPPFAGWFWEFSLLMAHQLGSKRARCPLLSLAIIIMGVLFALMEANRRL